MNEILRKVLDKESIQTDDKYMKKLLNIIRHHGNAVIT